MEPNDMTYKAARGAFSNAANRNGASLDTYHLKGYPGPNGEKLAVDVAVVGSSSASNIVVVSSGTHGVELPIGSMLQCRWLDAVREICSRDDQVRFVFVHALNPFGAAYGLRNDQDNIDVNRNFVDFSKKPKTSESYRALADAFSPKSLNPLAIANAWRKLLTFGLVTHSISEFKQALAGGQYDFPDGLYYGGDRPSWSRETWQSIVKEHVITQDVRHIWHVDIHAGDGPRGKMQLLVNTSEGSALHERVKPLGPPENVNLTQTTFANLSGDIVDFWPQLGLAKHCEVTPLAIEVGTSDFFIEGLDVLHAMIARNALRVNFNDHHRDAAKIIRRMRDKFSPLSDDKWREKATAQGNSFWNRLITQVSPSAMSCG